MYFKLLFFSSLGWLCFTSCHSDVTTNHSSFQPLAVVPTANQIQYQKQEMVGFIHFSINTFTDKEWGYGDESPDLFNPTELDVNQWVTVAKNAGMKELILTAKHHDGFCLWPSQYTEHSIKNSPYKNGNGDIVRELVDACRAQGLKVGLYLSPWDRNHPDYGTPDYIKYYRQQLTELLSQYGDISEIWFDGANGGDGYYGGAREERRIDRKTYYEWDSTFQLVKTLQPDILIFSDAGPDIHWIGNEHGYAGETFWSTIVSDSLVIGGSDSDYLNQGDIRGTSWIIGQCDVSIRPGWFYHSDQDHQVKTPNRLMDIYYKSVGRNGVLLLNLPPDQRGLIHENDVVALTGFTNLLQQTFKPISTTISSIEASSTWTGCLSSYLTDGLDSTFWAAGNSAPASLKVKFEEKKQIDHIVLKEPIAYGQRIISFSVSALIDGQWSIIAQESTIGYKRILKFKAVMTDQIKIDILSAQSIPAISEIQFFNSKVN